MDLIIQHKRFVSCCQCLQCESCSRAFLMPRQGLFPSQQFHCMSGLITIHINVSLLLFKGHRVPAHEKFFYSFPLETDFFLCNFRIKSRVNSRKKSDDFRQYSFSGHFDRRRFFLQCRRIFLRCQSFPTSETLHIDRLGFRMVQTGRRKRQVGQYS